MLIETSRFHFSSGKRIETPYVIARCDWCATTEVVDHHHIGMGPVLEKIASVGWVMDPDPEDVGPVQSGVPSPRDRPNFCSRKCRKAYWDDRDDRDTYADVLAVLLVEVSKLVDHLTRKDVNDD